MASPVVDVYVKLPSGRTSVLKLLPTECVRKINEQIAKEEGIPTGSIRMKYQGKILDKSKTIGYLGIRPETVLKADIVVPKDLRLYAKVQGGESQPLDIQNTASLYDLKTAVESLDIVSPMKIKHFKHNGTIYKPTNTALFETSIREESIIEVFTNSGNGNKAEEEPVDEELKEAILSSFQTEGKNVEVVFSFDTTGSMSSYLLQVRNNLRETCKRLLRDIPNIRIGMIAHGDYCDYGTYDYVLKIQDLTSDVQQLVDFAENSPKTGGGGNGGECYEWMLKHAKQLDWSEDSAKALVVIGDDVPHIPSYTDQKINWHAELDILKGMDIKVYGVFCNSGYNTNYNTQHFYEELADRTGGCHLKLANFSLITDMFLGVCYKESNQEQLEAFTEELKQEGKLTKETENMLKQLETSKPVDDKATDLGETQSYLNKYNYTWWKFDPNDSTHPQYRYDAEDDSWTFNQVPVPPPTPTVPKQTTKRRKHKNKGSKCSIS